MDFLEFVQLLSEINKRVFIGYEDPTENNQYTSYIYASIPGNKLWLPDGFEYDKETNTINSTSPDIELYNISVGNIYEVTDILADTLADKIREINGDVQVYGDPDTNIVYGDASLRDLKLPANYRMKNPRIIYHNEDRYKYVNTQKYKITDSRSKYSNKANKVVK